jgi:FkbM family methyltransferase
VNIRGKLHDFLYRVGADGVLAALRTPLLERPLSVFARVWLRHSRIARHLRGCPYDQVVDGGANVGEFAAIVRAICPGVPLVCVEPHPLAARTLRRRGFKVIEAALWQKEGTAVLTQPTSASTSASLLPVGGRRDQPSWNVRTVRLDQLPLEGSRILVKLDLQGAEPAALEGLEDAWDRVAAVLLEVSYGPDGTYEPLRQQLGRRGFAEAATLNELELGREVIEADKLWLRRPAASNAAVSPG